jgi:hypothetical protein
MTTKIIVIMNTMLIILIFLLIPTIVIGCIAITEEGKKRKLQIYLHKSFNALVREYNLSLADIDFFREKAIGIDTEKKKLLFVDKNNNKPSQMCINLKEFTFCLLCDRKDPHSNAGRIFLELVSLGNNENVQLDFFNPASDIKYAKMQLAAKAEYWKNKINLLINTKKVNRNLEYVL